MHPELMRMINAQRNKEMRDRGAAWRRAAETRGTRQARSARSVFAVTGRMARTVQSVPRLKPQRRPAAG